MLENSPTNTSEIIDAIQKARSEITDLFEVAIGSSENWPVYRSRVLRVFGQRGLEGKITDILNNSQNWNGPCDGKQKS